MALLEAADLAAFAELKEFSEDQHPRDDHGKFTSGGGADATASGVGAGRGAGISNLKGEGKGLSEKQALAAADKVLNSAGAWTGRDLSDVTVEVADYVPTARFNDETRTMLLSPSIMERVRDKDYGVFEFRQIDHEAMHAASGVTSVLPGISSTVEEGGAEILSVSHWATEGQPFGPLDAVRIDGTWQSGTAALTHTAVYDDEVVEVMSRAASSVGWDRQAVLDKVASTFAGDHNSRLHFRDSTDPTFAAPTGVERNAAALLDWLVADDLRAPGALRAAQDAATKAVALDRVHRAASLARARARAALLCSVKWDEAQHPRNELGRFTEDGGSVVHAVAGFDDLPKAQQDYVTREAHRWGVDERDLVQRGNAVLEAAQGHPGDNGAGWYAERQRDAQAYADKYGLSTEQVHGVIAALSPQTRWDNKDGGHPNLLHAEVVMGLWKDNPNLNGVPFRDALRDDIKGALTEARDQGWLRDQYGAVMRGNAENAFEILQGKDPGDVLEGNKTRSFFEQMRTGGKSDSATIDVWMMAALSGREPADQGGPGLPSRQLDIHVLDRGKTEDRGRLASGWVPNAGVYAVFDQSVRDIAAAHNMSVADAQAMIWTQVRDHGLPDSLVVKAEPQSSKRNTSPRGSGIPFIYDWTGEDPDFIDDPDGDLDGIIADVIAMVRRHTQGPAFKWDESEHPRDEHGRFSSDGGDRPDWMQSPDDEARVREAETRIRDALSPSIPRIELNGMDPDLAHTVADRVEHFAAKYPAAAGSIIAVELLNFDRADMPEFAMAAVDAVPPDFSRLMFNDEYFTDADILRGTLERSAEDGFHPDASVESVVDHELGHVLDNHLTTAASDSPSNALYEKYLDAEDVSDSEGAMETMQVFMTGKEPEGGDPVSYAIAGGPGEMWAELFMMSEQGLPMSDGAREFVERYKREEAEYKALRWTRAMATRSGPTCAGYAKPTGLQFKVFNEEDHPRNELGRFTDAGASAEGFDVMQHAAVEFGGFSVHPMTGDVPKTGFQVAIPGHALDPLPTVKQWAAMDDDAGAAMVAQWMEANAQAFAQPNVYVGGWVDGGRVYLEPSQRVEDRAEAVRLGVERGQKSIWSNADGVEINTGDTAAKSDRAGLAAQGVVGDDRRGEGRVLPRGVRSDEGGADQVQLKDFDEGAHPRDERGRFSSGGGESAGPVAGRDYQLTYKPNIGGRAERSALVRFRGVVDRGGGPTARFTVLDDPNHAIDTTTQLDLYLSASQLVALEARNDVPVRDSSDVTMHAWAEEHPAGTVYRAMSMDEVDSVRAGGQLGPPSGGNQLWVSSTPTMEYVDRGEVIGAIRTEPGEIEAGMPGGPGDWMLPHLPGDRLIDVWKPPADAPMVPYHLRGRLDTKFEEEQHPRDERGRFTSGGASLEGRAERLSDNPKDWKLHLEQAFPNATVMMEPGATHGAFYTRDMGYNITAEQLHDRSVGAGKGATAGLLDMAAKYPEAAAELKDIRLFPGMLKGAAMADYHPSPYDEAAIHRDGPAIRFDPQRIATSISNSVAGSLTSEGHSESENYERLGYGIAVHEFGHHVDTIQSGGPYSRSEYERVQREGTALGLHTGNEPYHAQSEQERLDDHVSGYAQLRPTEYFAELFAADQLRDEVPWIQLNDSDRAALSGLTVKAEARDRAENGSVCDGTFVGSVVWQLVTGAPAAKGLPRDRAETKSMVDPTDTRGGKALTKRYEAELAAILNRHLHRQQAVILQRLKGPKARQRTRHWSPPGERKIDAAKVVGADRWRNELMDDARPLLVRLYQQAGAITNRAIFQSMGVQPEDFDVESPSVADMIKARTDLIGDASDTLTARIRDQIARGEAAGEDIGTIADRVLATYGDTEEWWADRIAGDEVHASQMGAAHAAVLASGLGGQREWISVGDDRVRPAHVEADGQKVGVDEPFQVGGEELMYPGDPSGSPELVINCRCVVGYDFRAPEGAPTAEETAQLHVGGLAAKEWDESLHPRDEHGRFGEGGGAILPDEPVHDIGAYELVSDRDLVRLWVSGYTDRYPALEPAVVELVERVATTTPTLYRGEQSFEQRRAVESWTTDRAVAQEHADDRGGSVTTLSAGEARGMDVNAALGADAVRLLEREYGVEHEWIVLSQSIGSKMLQSKYDEGQHPRDERGRWTDAEGHASETATMLADVPRFVPNEPGDRPGYRDANDRAIAAFVERNGPEAQQYVDLIKGWTDIGSSQLSRAAVDGSTQRGRELAHYLDQAPTHADPLYRGTSALHLEPGFEFQLRPSSFTHDEGTGDHYALQMAGKGASAHPAVLEVLGGSRGLPVDALGKYPEEHEVISGGTFRVVSSEPKQIPGYGNPITVEHIVVEQIKPPLKSTDPGWWRPTRPLTAAEEEMSGTFAEVRDEGEVHLAHLRDLLANATKPPERRASS